MRASIISSFEINKLFSPSFEIHNSSAFPLLVGDKIFSHLSAGGTSLEFHTGDNRIIISCFSAKTELITMLTTDIIRRQNAIDVIRLCQHIKTPFLGQNTRAWWLGCF